MKAPLKVRFARWLRDKLWNWARPSTEEMILQLVLNTASLELPKGYWVDLKPLKGMCGGFRLEGNSLPVIHYRVFEKKIMEFVMVRVEVARPGRIDFVSTIDSTSAPERHGEVIETTDKYKEPFMQFLAHQFYYCPLTRTAAQKPEMK